MKFIKILFQPFSRFKKHEWLLYLLSLATVTVPSAVLGSSGLLSTVASAIGVTALIFVAKGEILGQVLTVVFALFYSVISLTFDYYGEMITYLFMSAPIAVMSVVSWVRHPYKDSAEVEVARLGRRAVTAMVISAAAVTFFLGLALSRLGNANILVSTVSITTSYLASYLMLFRSPYYALAYAANDIVLIILWTMASFENIGYLSMVICFAAFFANDIYGFMNWRHMQKEQSEQPNG